MTAPATTPSRFELMESAAVATVRAHWLLWWLLSRACVALMWRFFTEFHTMVSDVEYYARGTLHPQPGELQEYPAGSRAFLHLVGFPSGDSSAVFVALFVAALVLVDVAFTRFLARREYVGGLTLWCILGALLGPLMFLRLDLLPGVLAAVAVAIAVGGPAERQCRLWPAAVAGGILGVATLMKIWPIVLGAVLVRHWRDRRTWVGIGTFIGSLVLLCAMTVLFSGPEGLTGALRYQTDRGVQVESIFATPPLLATAFRFASEPVHIIFSQFKAFDLAGNGVSQWTATGDIFQFLFLLGIIAWAVFILFRSPVADDEHAQYTGVLALVIVGGLLITNKVFSPQYLVWLVAMVAAVWDFSIRPMCQRRSDPDRWRAWLVGLLIAVTSLTLLIYPFFYDLLLAVRDWAVATLALRNALLITFVALVLGVAVWPAAAHYRPGRLRPGVILALVYLAGQTATLAVLLRVESLSSSGDTTRSLLDLLGEWDSQWYIRIAESGYRGGEMIDGVPPQDRTVAFLPLVPMLIRVTHLVTGLPFIVSALLLNLALGAAAAVLIGRLLRHYQTPFSLQILSVIVFATAPMSVTLSMAYTEALFSLLTVGFLLSCQRRQWGRAGLCVFLACITRMTGAALWIALVIVVLVAIVRAIQRHEFSPAEGGRALLAVVLSPLGLITYLLWVSSITATVSDYFSAQQAGWGTQFDFGYTTITHFTTWIQPAEFWAYRFGAAAVAAVIVAGIYGFIRVLRGEYPLAVWLVGAGIAATVVGSTGFPHSRPRLLMTAIVVLFIPVLVRLYRSSRTGATFVACGCALTGISVSAYMLAIWPYAI